MAVLTRLKRLRGAAALILVVCGGLALARPIAAASLEYAVKANYLYKFTPFVAWPETALPAGPSPLSICIVGEDPFGAAMDDAVRGQAVDGHPLVVRRFASVAATPDCQVIYLGRGAAKRPVDILSALRGAPVLTVTDDAAGFGGGIIHFVVRDGKVRFGIDAGAAQASGLTISSKLFALAVPLAPEGR